MLKWKEQAVCPIFLIYTLMLLDDLSRYDILVGLPPECVCLEVGAKEPSSVLSP